MVDFEKKEVIEYLDLCIRYWRKARDNGDEKAIYYVDAFQSVRISLFGDFLKEDDECQANLNVGVEK